MKGTVRVDFGKMLRKWDGFGVNYVAAAQTRDYDKWPQDYGSFGLLSEDDRQQIIELIFGDDGLKPSIGKMFIDSLQAGMTKPERISGEDLRMDLYDHRRTTQWMRYFWREGLKRTKARGEDLTIVATLYGPAPWMTKQRIVRGRDLDPAEKVEVAKYIIAFAKFMKEEEGLPISYLSLHNEGGIEEMRRWPEDATDGPDYLHHDYNMIWPEAQVVDFISFMGSLLKKHGLSDVGLANGECTFLKGTTKYVKAIIDNEQALANYALLTSHGFGTEDWAFTSEPLDLIREVKHGFRGWVTSSSWGKMDIGFVTTIHKHIYHSKVNGYIPWAVVQRHSQWVGGDPNPGTGFLISDEGKWDVKRGYYLYKHYCPVGRAGMGIAETFSSVPNVMVSAFASNGTNHPDALVIINEGSSTEELSLEINGTAHRRFQQIVTDNDNTYAKGDEDIVFADGKTLLTVAPESITTLIAI